MSIGAFGNLTAKAADAVGEIIGTGVYPETDHALAAFLFDRILQFERDSTERDRDYYFDLMERCLETVKKH